MNPDHQLTKPTTLNMGKVEDEQSSLSSSSTSALPIPNNAGTNRCPKICKLVTCRCVIALVFSIAVVLSAVFWLPPFFQRGNWSDLDLESILRAHKVVASFELPRPVSMLNENIQQLETDILDEIGVPNSMVTVVSLIPSAVSNTTNTTKVVFAVVPDLKSSNISPASLSLLRASFVSLVLHQSSLHLTPSLFGDPISFEVLKFNGGITVIPQQSAFLLQKAQTLFNFTLNFSIHELQENFDELKNQLKLGLHLTLYENLYVSLKNSVGSTAAPPTTVQASVLLAIGNLPPSLPRLKQLAQTIKNSPGRNLGLNHTVFGKVKQVRLSSVLQHSLNSGGSSGTSASPSPAPMPHPNHGHHHHHHHHHSQQHHHPDFDQAPAPAPEKTYHAIPPSACRGGSTGKNQREHHKAPNVAPVEPPRYSAASPRSYVDPPVAVPHVLPPSPHAHSPNENAPAVGPPDITPTVSPLHSSASCLFPTQCSLALLLLLIRYLL